MMMTHQIYFFCSLAYSYGRALQKSALTFGREASSRPADNELDEQTGVALGEALKTNTSLQNLK